jgi:DNA-binding transcriptional regulator/RsmH inhibitor MraZ
VLNNLKGQFEANIDSKKRVAFPPAFKKVWEFDSEGAITIQVERKKKILNFFPESKYVELMGEYKRDFSLVADESRENEKAEFCESIFTLSMEGNGRIMLNDDMIECLDLKGQNEIIFHGRWDYVYAVAKNRNQS